MVDRLISCDDHMDLGQLPADLWLTRLPASLRDRAPRVEERDGQAVWICDGKVWGSWGGKSPATGNQPSTEVEGELSGLAFDRDGNLWAGGEAGQIYRIDASGQVPEGGGNHFGPVAYAGFGVGATGFVAGTVLAAATMSKASSISCSNAACEQSSECAAGGSPQRGWSRCAPTGAPASPTSAATT